MGGNKTTLHEILKYHEALGDFGAEFIGKIASYREIQNSFQGIKTKDMWIETFKLLKESKICEQATLQPTRYNDQNTEEDPEMQRAIAMSLRDDHVVPTDPTNPNSRRLVPSIDGQSNLGITAVAHGARCPAGNHPP